MGILSTGRARRAWFTSERTASYNGGSIPGASESFMRMRALMTWRLLVFSACLALPGVVLAEANEDLQVEITKKGLGKEVVITQGAKEWFMLIEVTPENTVVVRQEKDHDKYLVDESETHDRPLVPAEVDAAIADYVNSVKARAKKK
jgi:hypothetical protein